MPSQNDIKTFFPWLMIYCLCRMFDGTQVDGIHFQEASFDKVVESNCLNFTADEMMDEYIRLTNIAFGVKCNSPPVFLLDEVQILCKPTTVESKVLVEGEVVYHSYLSLLLTQLANKHKPVCISTTTHYENIFAMIEESRIIPKIILLTTFDKKLNEIQ